jgi:hypothetical protein
VKIEFLLPAYPSVIPESAFLPSHPPLEYVMLKRARKAVFMECVSQIIRLVKESKARQNASPKKKAKQNAKGDLFFIPSQNVVEPPGLSR